MQTPFDKDELLAATVDDPQPGQLLQYSLVIPKRQPETELHRFMCTDFVDAVRKCLQAGGYASKEKDVESAGVFLAAVSGRIFRIDSDYQVAENRVPYDSVGCGDAYAIAVLHATRTSTERPEFRLKLALETAEEFSAGVRGPFVFEAISARMECAA